MTEMTTPKIDYEQLLWKAKNDLEDVIRKANKVGTAVEDMIFFPNRPEVGDDLFFDEIAEATYNLKKLHAKLRRMQDICLRDRK